MQNNSPKPTILALKASILLILHIFRVQVRFSGCEVLEWPDEALPVFSDEALGNFDFATLVFNTSKRGGGSRGEGTREPWGALGKLRECKGILACA